MGLIEDAHELERLRVWCHELYEENIELRKELEEHTQLIRERAAYDASPEKLLNIIGLVEYGRNGGGDKDGAGSF